MKREVQRKEGKQNMIEVEREGGEEEGERGSDRGREEGRKRERKEGM